MLGLGEPMLDNVLATEALKQMRPRPISQYETMGLYDAERAMLPLGPVWPVGCEAK
jgi:hypothetical protein